MDKIYPEGIATIILVAGGNKYVPIPRIGNSEIWTMTTGLPLHRVTRLFEVHDFMSPLRVNLVKEVNPDITYVICNEFLKMLPNATKLPVKKLVDRFGPYFNNTISYMIGMAIIEHEEEIAAGLRKGTVIHMRRMHTSTQSHEYVHQVPQIREYIGIARGLGIDVRVSEHSILKDVIEVYQAPRSLWAEHQS